MTRVFNFSAGPAVLPEAVLKKAASEMLDYRGSGMSVMEMSHRSKWFTDIADKAQADLRTLMHIPDNYKVLFLQGGASTQFTMIPMNLFGKSKSADYISTGSWSKKAVTEAARFGEVRVVASSQDQNFNYIPDLNGLDLNPDADYLHITTNNTIYGTLYSQLPACGSVSLVADMSSHILSQNYDVRDFGLIYAGAQKNIGPSGLTIVIVRNDLVGSPLPNTPTMLDYQTHVKADSRFNTPPSYSVYVAGLVFEWLLEQGGVDAMADHNRQKADLLYDFLDQSARFSATVAKPHRSLMNVTFVTGDAALDATFIHGAAELGLVNLKGHRSVGGMRASIYNAMPLAGVRALVDFMADFEKKHP